MCLNQTTVCSFVTEMCVCRRTSPFSQHIRTYCLAWGTSVKGQVALSFLPACFVFTLAVYISCPASTASWGNNDWEKCEDPFCLAAVGGVVQLWRGSECVQPHTWKWITTLSPKCDNGIRKVGVKSVEHVTLFLHVSRHMFPSHLQPHRSFSFLLVVLCKELHELKTTNRLLVIFNLSFLKHLWSVSAVWLSPL